jgi:hypothetical protein
LVELFDDPEKLVALIVVFTVAFPIEIPVVDKLILAPTLSAVEMLAVAGSLAVGRVPFEILVALAAKVTAFV